MLRKRVRNESNNWRVFATSTRKARKSRAATDATKRAQLRAESGMDHLEKYIFEEICGNPEIPELLKMRTTVLHAQRCAHPSKCGFKISSCLAFNICRIFLSAAAQEVLDLLQQSEQLLAQKNAMLQAVRRRNADFVREFFEEFNDTDIASLDRMVSTTRRAIETFFQDFKLRWMVGGQQFADRLFASVYATSRLNEAEHMVGPNEPILFSSPLVLTHGCSRV